jgi:hypothetical protein
MNDVMLSGILLQVNVRNVVVLNDLAPGSMRDLNLTAKTDKFALKNVFSTSFS